MEIMMFYTVLALPIIITFLIKSLMKRNLRRHPPGPPTLPIIGNLHQFDSSRLHVSLKQLSDKYGPLMHMKLVNKPILVISSAKFAKEALKDNDLTFSSRPKTTSFVRLSYENLDISTAPYSDYWRDVRKLVVQHLFTRKQIDASLSIVAEEVSRMVGQIAVDQPVVVNDLAWTYSTGVISRVAFGKRYDETASGKKRVESLLNGLQDLTLTMFAADFFPFLGWIDRLTGKHAQLERAFHGLDAFYQELIDEHLSPNRPDSMNGDLLDILIKLREDSQKDGGSSNTVQFDWGNVKSILMNMIVAGAGTSSAPITWAMTALVKNPQAMKRVQEEIRSVVGSANKGKVEEEDIERLPYFKAVVKESFRMYPATPLMVPRETTKRSVIDGYEIEPKTMVYVNVWAIGRDPQAWEKPNEFIPERFLEKKIDYKGLDYELLPFGAGRRKCPGIPLGAANVELALANLLYSFDWELPRGVSIEDVDVEGMPGIATYKKNPLLLVPKRRLPNLR